MLPLEHILQKIALTNNETAQQELTKHVLKQTGDLLDIALLNRRFWRGYGIKVLCTERNTTGIHESIPILYLATQKDIRHDPKVTGAILEAYREDVEAKHLIYELIKELEVEENKLSGVDQPSRVESTDTRDSEQTPRNVASSPIRIITSEYIQQYVDTGVKPKIENKHFRFLKLGKKANQPEIH